MKVVFLGVGEAFDENYPNNSSLVLYDKASIMLDCGDSSVVQLWKFSKGNHNLVDAVYITHRHSDHFFGLPAMLGRFLEEKRKNPLTIIYQKSIKSDIEKVSSYAYQGLKSNFSFDLNLIEIENGQSIDFNGLKLSFALTRHSIDNMAINIDDGKKSLVYSGDGLFSEQDNFYKDLDLLIQETYLYDQEKIGHASIIGAIKFAGENNIKCLALTHINRDFRKNELPKIKDKIKSDKVKIIIPEPLDEYNL